jgi:hypothetical protein
MSILWVVSSFITIYTISTKRPPNIEQNYSIVIGYGFSYLEFKILCMTWITFKWNPLQETNIVIRISYHNTLLCCFRRSADTPLPRLCCMVSCSAPARGNLWVMHETMLSDCVDILCPYHSGTNGRKKKYTHWGLQLWTVVRLPASSSNLKNNY